MMVLPPGMIMLHEAAVAAPEKDRKKILDADVAASVSRET